MAVLTTLVLVLGLIAAGGATFFLASAINTIMHIAALLGSIAATGFLFYRLDQWNPLELNGELPAALTYIAVSGFTGFFLYRVFEALIATANALIALVSILIVALLFFNPALLFRLGVGVYNLLIEVLDN